MAEFPPSPVGRSPRRNWIPALTAMVGVLVIAAIAKPWGVPAAPVPTFLLPTPGAGVAVPSPRSFRGTYNPYLFGTKEPEPAWELWPAGYVVEIGLAGPVAVDPQQDAPPSAAPPSAKPHRSPGSGRPTAEPSAPDLPSLGPVLDLGSADHLIALGVNTPADVRVISVGLELLRNDGSHPVAVPFIGLPMPWESQHFFVIGIEDPLAPGTPGPWRVGLYRLSLGLASGETRTVAFRVASGAG